MACGWSWEYIDEHMTLPRLAALTRYWDQFPPLHVLVAGAVGYEARKPAADPGELFEMLGGPET